MRLSSLKPSYLFPRLGQIAFERSFPDAPWLCRAAVLLLENWLKPDDRGMEWGSGRSTVWFARRVAHFMSVEDSRQWYDTTRKRIEHEGLADRIDYRFVPCELHEQAEPEAHPYADAALSIPDGSLDFALVDGNIRLLCLNRILPKLKPGGLLILDNAERYVPNRFLGRHTTAHSPRKAPPTPGWREALNRLKDWRWIDTSNGIWDTRFWVKLQKENLDSQTNPT